MENVDFGLTKRDLEIIELMSSFGGKTYIFVLAKTFWLKNKNAEQQARNRIQKLKKKKLVRYKETGLTNPKNVILFSDAGKRFVFENFGININDTSVSPFTTWHTIYEQITFYNLKLLSKNVERTIVKKWKEKGYSHTPDLVYTNKKDKNVYIEIELTLKRPDRYMDIFTKMQKDDVGTVLYVFENDKKMKVLGTKIPIWDRIYYTTIDKIIESGEKGKLIAKKQKDFLEEIGK